MPNVRDLNLRDREIVLEDPDTDRQRGRAQRKATPRKALAELVAADRSATEILVDQNASRVPELVGLRFARMLVDPAHFYRGAAAVMAADLAASPTSDIDVMCCGDAHLSNFGVFAAPDRALVFDLNDFDEAAVAPAEWDLKRLVTSAIVLARDNGFSDATVGDIAEGAAQAYHSASAYLLEMSVLDRFYLRVEPGSGSVNISKELDEVLRRSIARARKRTSVRAFDRLTAPDAHGTPRFKQTSLTRHVPMSDESALREAVDEYTSSARVDVRLLLAHFTATDIAMRVVGVGSVGTRCYITSLIDAHGTPLILQIKEAKRSVLEQYGGRAQPPALREAINSHGEGRRVVDGQRILQAGSDMFLGTTRVGGAHYYVRQFHDMKGGLDPSGLGEVSFAEYAQACAVTLARAHSQSDNAAVLRGYVGGGGRALGAIVAWCFRYADKTVADYEELRAAARAGDIEVADDPLLR